MHGVYDRAGPNGISRWRFRRCCLRHRGTASAPRKKTFAAPYPVRTPPYRRLRCVLADTPPRLGAGSGRYCLTVWLSHPLLSASYWHITPWLPWLQEIPLLWVLGLLYFVYNMCIICMYNLGSDLAACGKTGGFQMVGDFCLPRGTTIAGSDGDEFQSVAL